MVQTNNCFSAHTQIQITLFNFQVLSHIVGDSRMRYLYMSLASIASGTSRYFDNGKNEDHMTTISPRTKVLYKADNFLYLMISETLSAMVGHLTQDESSL